MFNSIGNTITYAMHIAGVTRNELAVKFGVSKRVMDQKFQRSNWDASDLTRIAEFLGASLNFSFLNGALNIPIAADKPVRKRVKTDLEDCSE